MSKRTTETLDFESWAQETRAEYAKALAAESPPKKRTKKRLRPAQTSSGVLYNRCYRFYRKLKRDEKLTALAKRLAADPSGRWIRHKRKGIANVLRLLEEAGKEPLLTPTRRNRMTRELEFADSFDIHPKLLLAFLYEAGAHQDIVKASRSDKAPSFIRRYQDISKLITASKARPDLDGD